MFTVNFNKLIRASFYAFIIGGALTLLIGTSQPITLAFILAGWTGMYLRQSNRAGAMGRAGYVMFVLSILLPAVFPVRVDPTTTVGVARADYPLLAFYAALQIGGYVLFGIATMRAHVFPRDAGLLLVIAAPLVVVFAQYGSTLIYVLLGFTLLLNRSLFRPTAEAEGEELATEPDADPQPDQVETPAEIAGDDAGNENMHG